MLRRTFDTVNLAMIVWMVGFALWAWPGLPDRIPLHFGLDGRADAWGGKTPLSWFAVPGVALCLTALFWGIRSMLPRRPGWVNLPDRTRLQDLPPPARQPVLEMLSWFLALIQTEMLVIFALIQVGTFREAMGAGSQGIFILVLLIAVMASPVLMVVFFLSLQQALERGKARAAASEVS